MLVTPPGTDDPTLHALRGVLCDIEDNQERRAYLGASGVGHSCERKSWYYYHMPHLRKPLNDNGHLAVNCGHRAEATMAAYLRMIPGIELHTEQDGQQVGFSDFNGRFRGHLDGIIRGLYQAPKTVHVWEHKDANQKKFNEFQRVKQKYGEKNALYNWNIVYYGQAQLYMHYMGLTRHYMTVSLSGVRDFDSCRTEYNKEYAKMLVSRADRIINAKEPLTRISNKPDYYECRWCDFNEVCHAAS